MNLTYRRGRETIQSILDEARQEKWHVGIRYALYESYRVRIIRLATNNTQRDQALASLRLIFGMVRLP